MGVQITAAGTEKTTLDGTEVLVMQEAAGGAGSTKHFSVEAIRDFVNSVNQTDYAWWFEDFIGNGGPVGAAVWRLIPGTGMGGFLFAGPANQIQRVDSTGGTDIQFASLSTNPIAFSYNGWTVKYQDTSTAGGGADFRPVIGGKAVLSEPISGGSLDGSFLTLRAPLTSGDYLEVKASTPNANPSEANVESTSWITTPGNRIKLRSDREWVCEYSFALMGRSDVDLSAHVGLHAGNTAAMTYTGYSLSTEVVYIAAGPTYTLTPRVYKNGTVVSGFSAVTLDPTYTNSALSAIDIRYSNVPTSGNDGTLTLEYRVRTTSAVTTNWTTVAAVTSSNWQASPGFYVTPMAYVLNGSAGLSDHSVGVDYFYYAVKRTA